MWITFMIWYSYCSTHIYLYLSLPDNTWNDDGRYILKMSTSQISIIVSTQGWYQPWTVTDYKVLTCDIYIVNFNLK